MTEPKDTGDIWQTAAEEIERRYLGSLPANDKRQRTLLVLREKEKLIQRWRCFWYNAKGFAARRILWILNERIVLYKSTKDETGGHFEIVIEPVLIDGIKILYFWQDKIMSSESEVERTFEVYTNHEDLQQGAADNISEKLIKKVSDVIDGLIVRQMALVK